MTQDLGVPNAVSAPPRIPISTIGDADRRSPKRDSTGVVEQLRTGEKLLVRRYPPRLLDLPGMAFRGLLADLHVGGFHAPMVLQWK